jgi:hypothetical protein
VFGLVGPVRVVVMDVGGVMDLLLELTLCMGYRAVVDSRV